MKAKKVLMSLDAGARLGHYEIRSRLGAGGMGEVYLARDTSELERTVALKFLPAELASDQKRMQRFIQEAKTVSALNHPNILTIYEFGQADSVRFIAMEYVDGVTLREQMRERRLKLHDVLDTAVQIAAALNAAHEAGVVHRDIKPENIMVRRDHIVKVLDFGLAKLTMKEAAAESVSVDSEAGTKVLVHTEPGLVMGTASYMSPEQSQASAKVDHRTDIWSLGVVFYEMVAGRVPFEGKDIHRQIIAIQETDPPPLSKFAEGVPERLEEIVEKALAKDPDERYQTAKDLLIDLRNLKRKLDVDAEIERTYAPEFRSTTSGASGTQGTASNAQQSSAQTTPVGQAQPTSSAEYIVSQIKQHKRGAALIALALVFAAATVAAYFYLSKRNGEPTRSTSADTIDSIAVLPLTNESHDPNVDWLADGLTESIIYKLSQLPNLKVLARSTVFRYKGKEIDPAQAARELNVRAVLTGRVLQHGDDLTVSAELIDTRDNRLLWGERYDRKMTDLNAVQQEIARVVSEKLRQKLTGEEQRQLAKQDTTNSEAYQFYLKGRYYWNKRSPDNFRKAISYFQQALERDPNYALAYSGLADAYCLLPNYGGSTPAETMPKAKAAARKALEIDDSLAEGHASLGQILFYDWDFAGGERELRRAIELNPNYASAHQWLGELLSAMGRFDEAIAEVRRALELDPLSLIINRVLADAYYSARRYDEAIEQYRKTIEIDPNFATAHGDLGDAFAAKGMHAEAVAEYAKSDEIMEGEEGKKNAAAILDAYAKGGWKGFLQQNISHFKELSNRSYVPPSFIAAQYAQLGEKDEAFAWLEKDYQEHGFAITDMKVDPQLDNLRSDPRFADLMRRVGLPQ
ncbi:MAG TPA: protein kinase [Pyrinomonadaceae bacterium]|nr:protein kinase [Pyrinomonadaceae bacterium]